MNTSKKATVLEDHKRARSKLVTPLNDVLGPIQEVSWINTMIPELLWIALIQEAWGPRRGVEIITAFTRDLRASDPTRNSTIWASAGKYATLPDGALLRVVEGRPYRSDLCGPLAPLHIHYPDHPMRELVTANAGDQWSHDLGILKALLGVLFERSSEFAIMVQATAIWLAFDADRLKVSAGLDLADFPRIEDYPRTEQSKRIAGSIRSTLNAMFGDASMMASETEWPVAFWNRGLELEACED